MTILEYLIPVALGAVVLVLVLGLVGMVKGGETAKRHSNTLMRWRVGLQALVVALLALFLFVGQR